MTVIAITGVGATGKTSVARALVERLEDKDYRLIELNKLAAELNAYTGYDEKRKSKIVDLDKLKEEVEKLKEKHKNLIIEGLYAHEFPVDLVIVLRCDPEALERRLKKKYEWPTKIKENKEAEMINLITEEAMEKTEDVYEIDTTDRTVKESVDCILEILEGKCKKYRAGRIDWLG